MSDRKLRLMGLSVVASAGAGVLALTSVLHSAFAYGDDSTPDIGLVMGGSGLAIPGPEYVKAADELFINNQLAPNFPDTTFPDPYANGLFTPEGLYPLTGVKTLSFNFPNGNSYPAGQETSVAQGVTILDNAITSNDKAGDVSTVFGYSQSSTIASQYMAQVDPSGTPDTNIDAQFVLIGDPSAPNGGLLERFNVPGVPLNIPSLGTSFDSFTPADAFDTVIYTREWDGFADFPRYPINLLSDLNAFLGITYVHGHYLELSPDQIAPESSTNPDGAILLPGSMDYGSGTTDSMTNYYMIPTADLPLLDPVRAFPFLGNPIADLLQPDLTLLVNLGYDNPNPLDGWDAGPANVPTPFELLPSLSQVEGALKLLPSQTLVGIHDFIGDFTGSGPNPVSLASVAAIPAEVGAAAQQLAADPASLLASLPAIPTEIATTVANDVSTLYGTLLPTADIVTAVAVNLPGYDAGLFLDNLTNPVNAIGLPIAADFALLTLAAGFEFDTLESAITTVLGSL